jgi:hypothetical protein
MNVVVVYIDANTVSLYTTSMFDLSAFLTLLPGLPANADNMLLLVVLQLLTFLLLLASLSVLAHPSVTSVKSKLIRLSNF